MGKTLLPPPGALYDPRWQNGRPARLENASRRGYVDIAYKLGQHTTPTVPGAAFPDAEFVPFRADYFLVSEALSRGVKSYMFSPGI